MCKTMTYKGRIENGAVVLDDGAQLPEGAVVAVTMVDLAETSPQADTPTIWQKLTELAREMEQLPCDLPTDLAANHDHYLHGLPKRQ